MRAAHRLKVSVVFVANKTVALPESALFRFQLVTAGPDQADLYIVEQAQTGDLVVSHDIPLAASLVPKGVVVIDPGG